jgi:hypothetical protein
MRRLIAVGLSAVVAVFVTLLPGSAPAQQKSLKDQLVGTWTVVSWEQTAKNGTKFQRFGANPKGVNMFTPDGHFFVMFARADLPKISSGDPNTPSPEEAMAITKGSIAYFGTYSVDDKNKIVEFRIDSGTLANQIGREQKRKITSLTANELKYTNLTAVSGDPIDIAFKRAK